jgi:hypothetical protein
MTLADFVYPVYDLWFSCSQRLLNYLAFKHFGFMHWKCMEFWIGTKNLFFCSSYNAAPTLFQTLQKKFFKMHGAWHSPNMLPTMVHGQTFSIIT